MGTKHSKAEEAVLMTEVTTVEMWTLTQIKSIHKQFCKTMDSPAVYLMI